MPELAAKDSSVFVPLGPFAQRLHDMKILPPEPKEKEFARAVERTQSAIVHSFRDEVRVEFPTLADTQLWN